MTIPTNEHEPGPDTLKKLLLTAEQRAQLAEAKLESIQKTTRRHIYGLLDVLMTIVPVDDIMAHLIKRGEK